MLEKEKTETLEERLSDSEARFSLAFDQAPIGMVLLKPDGTLVDVNQAFVDMLGYSVEELLARDSSMYTHPEDVALTRNFFASLQKGPHKTGSIEKRYFRKDGAMLWTRASATMRRDQQGQPAQVIAIVENITDRKRAEERLFESQQRLRATYDSTYEYIGLLATDGTLVDCNRASLEFAGNTREDVIGHPFWETAWFSATPGAAEAVREGVAAAARGEFVRYEAALVRPSGEVLTFDFSIHPVFNERGEVVFLVPEGRNITERKNTEWRDAFLVELDDATRPLTVAQEIIQTAARLLSEHLKVNRCAYSIAEADENTYRVAGDYTRGVPSTAPNQTWAFTQFGHECLRLLRAGKAFVVEDAETDPRALAGAEAFKRLHIRSAIFVPLRKAGRLVAAMAVHQITPRKWSGRETELVQSVAARCWESMERAHAERALREREHRYRFLAESIPQMVWTASAEGNLDYVNRQGAVYFGVPEEALLGAGWLEWVHPEDREQTVERWRSSLATGEAYETEFRLRRSKDGSWRWHLVRALPLRGEDGGVTQWFGTCTDIEAQKQADGNLREQWSTFDTALSHTPDFTYTFDLAGRFTYVNQALLSLWQKSLEDALGRNFHELDYPPELAETLQRQIQQVIDTRQPVRDQTPFTGPTGETRHYDYIFVPVFDDAGGVRAVAGSTRDITEQQRTEEELRRMNRELEEFAYVASHDLQEPLRMVNIYAQLIAENPASEKEELLQYSGFVKEGVKRMETLIHDLLTFSRSVHAEVAPVGVANLSEALREAMSVLKDRIEKEEAAIEAPELPAVRGETAQLAHVFQNVLSNALKYRRENSPPQIHISAKRDGEKWVIAIRDNGIGFDPQYAVRIFGLFKRLHRDEYPGTGLGLAICQRIIERYGGRMWAEGRLGHGATFYFSLAEAGEPAT